MTSRRINVVFVHGFLSSPGIWSRFTQLLSADADLSDFDLHLFRYASPRFSLHPMRRIPNLNNVADSLRTYLRHRFAGQRLVLVSHSQGGLVVQRLLARTLADGGGRQLEQLRQIVMFACPNSGSDIALLLRRHAFFWRHPQEVELRPLNESIADTHRVVINQVVYATTVAPDRCPVPIAAYAGDQDRVVTPASATSVFPSTGVLPADHSSIVQPDSPDHPSYLALRHHLLTSLTEPAPTALAPPPPRVAGEPSVDPGPAPARVPRPRPESSTLPASHDRELVDALLAVPRLSEPAYREQLYQLLPPQIVHQLRRDPAARVELLGLVRSFADYPQLAPWDSLAAALATLQPDQPQVAILVELLIDRGVLGAR